MTDVRRFDRRIWTKISILTVLVCGLFVSIARGQGAVPIGPPLTFTNPPSLIDKWLEPTTLLTVAALLMYAGGLREDIKRLKRSADAFDELRSGLDRRIEDSIYRYHNRRTTDS